MPTRRSSEQLRSLLIESGLRVLYRRGLQSTASHVPMTEAIKELAESHGISVTMGSIFGKGRLWANVGEFQLELLEAAVDDRASGGPNDRSMALIQQVPDQRDRPLSERIEMLVDLCRIAGSMNGYVDVEPGKHRSWSLWVSIWAMAMNDVEARDRLLPALRAEERRTTASFADVQQVMLDKLGLRLKAPYQLHHLSVLAASITDGVALRSGIDADLVGPVVSHRDDQEWTLLGVGLAAIALEMLEDDADRPAR